MTHIVSERSYTVSAHHLKACQFSGTALGAASAVAANGIAVWALVSGRGGWQRLIATSILTNTIPRMIQNAYIWHKSEDMHGMLHGKDVKQWPIPAAARGALSGLGYWWEGALKAVMVVMCARFGPDEKVDLAIPGWMSVGISSACRSLRMVQMMRRFGKFDSEEYLSDELNAFKAEARIHYPKHSWKVPEQTSTAEDRTLFVATKTFGGFSQLAQALEFCDWFMTAVMTLAIRTKMAHRQ